MISDLMIKSFLTLADTLNFTNAAKQLYLSQQAVSKHIAKLEEALDCQLFVRTRGNINLTPAGKIYFKVFSEYEKNLNTAKVIVRSMNHTSEKKIVIGHLEMLDISHLLHPIAKRFQELYPDITIEYRSSSDWELPILLKEDKIDISITFSMEVADDAPVNKVTLENVQELLFVSKEHPLVSTATKYEDFRSESVFFSLPPSGNVSNLLKRMDSYGFSYDKLICTENMMSSCTAVDMMQGVSFAIAPSKILTQGNYQTYPTDNHVAIIACYDKQNENTGVKEFCDVVNEIYEQQ